MFLVAVLVWYVDVGPRLPGRLGEGARRLQPRRDEPAAAPAGAGQTTTLTAAPARVSALTLVAALLATVLAVGSIVQVVRIGESGSKAVWQGNVSSQPHQLPGDR
jgi:hypothetical protein